MSADAYKRFIDSMVMDFDKWHDGIGYDLAALSELTPEELASVEQVLIARRHEDWRDTEALAALGSAKAEAALRDSIEGPNRTVRLRAARALKDDAAIEAQIIEGLTNGAIGDGLSQAEDMAAQHPTEAVKAALLKGLLTSDDGRAVRFAALLFFLYGVTDEPFDWNHRPFFLRFLETDRMAAFAELCEQIGVDPASVSKPRSRSRPPR